jgi:hypothetical protein
MSVFRISSSVFSFFLIVHLLNPPLSLGDKDPDMYVSVAEAVRSFDGEWEKAFYYVRDNIRFDPSSHLLKSSQGVLWGHRGNAREQALLLADILEKTGEKVRLASGLLDSEASAPLIISLFPGNEAGNFTYAEDVPVSRPFEDKRLLARISDHHWIQLHKHGRWLDLDPAFPGAVPGQSFAKAEKIYAVSNENVFPEMTITLNVEKEEGKEEVLKLESNVQSLSNQPITLSISTGFQDSGDRESSAASPGGLFGGMGQSASGTEKAKGLVANYQAKLRIGDEREVSSMFKEEIPGPGKKASAKNSVKKVWLNFRLTGGGKVLLESERILFEKVLDKDVLPFFQRHSILITANSVPREAWEDDLKKVTETTFLETIKKEVEQIKAAVKSKEDKNALLSESRSLEERIGPELCHLVNMIFAHTSDSLAEDAGESLSVYGYYDLPRIIIYSVESNGKSVKTSMDLRQDSMSAIPYPGQALGMAETFLYGRGVSESVLEGKILELFLGQKTLTTAGIMLKTAQRNVPIRLYSEMEKDELEKLAMPEHVQNRALKAISSGSILIVPGKSIRFQGQDRWGWWEVAPQTMEVIGVLDTGLHQAMLQRTILDSKGMMNSKMGFAIGGITGAVDTHWMLGSMILKYGKLTREALQEIRDYMKQLKTFMCPEFEKSVSRTVASLTVFELEDCYKKEYDITFKAGVKIDIGWCQSFTKGFGCISTSILNILDYTMSREH